jgi:hypothetical protein
VGDARSLVAGASELVDAMRTSDWIAEQPEAHLLPHLERTCGTLPLRLESTRTDDDGTFVVELTWLAEPNDIRSVREAAFTLAGSIAEGATYLRQRRPPELPDVDAAARDGHVTYELVTGMIGQDTSFAPHGHAVRFVVAGVFS